MSTLACVIGEAWQHVPLPAAHRMSASRYGRTMISPQPSTRIEAEATGRRLRPSAAVWTAVVAREYQGRMPKARPSTSPQFPPTQMMLDIRPRHHLPRSSCLDLPADTLVGTVRSAAFENFPRLLPTATCSVARTPPTRSEASESADCQEFIKCRGRRRTPSRALNHAMCVRRGVLSRDMYRSAWLAAPSPWEMDGRKGPRRAVDVPQGVHSRRDRHFRSARR